MHPRCRLIQALSIAAICLPLSPVRAQGPMSYTHVYDTSYRLVAYELSPTEEASFVRDGQLSPFWTAWDTYAGYGLDQACINGVNQLTWGEPTADTGDGEVNLKVCYGQRGIYLLFTVTDDAWSGYTHWFDFMNDAIILYGNQLSAQDLYSNPASYLPCNDVEPYQQLNATYFEMQIRFGLESLEPVETFSMNKWNPAATDISVFGCGAGNILYDREVTFDEALSLGILIDHVDQTQQSVRRQEWLIPWSQWGSTNPPTIGPKKQGESVAMTFGYNDLDPLVQVEATAMRWRQCEPNSNTDWNRPALFAESTTVKTALDAWGEIYFGPKLDDIVLTVDPCYWCSPNPIITSTPPATAVVNQEYVYQVKWTYQNQPSAATLSLTSGPQGMYVDGSSVRWLPSESDGAKQWYATIRVTWVSGVYTDQSFSISVDNGEGKPVFTTVPPSQAFVGRQYRYQPAAYDQEYPQSHPRMQLVLAPTGMFMDPDWLVTWTPTFDQVGVHEAAVMTFDWDGRSAMQRFRIQVTAGGASVPVIVAPGPLTATVNEAFYAQLQANDPAGDPLYWVMLAGPRSLVLDSAGGIAWTPEAAFEGNTALVVSVTDGVYADTGTIIIRVMPANGPPVISMAIPDTFVTDSLYLLQMTARDPEGAAVSWTIVTKPENMLEIEGFLVWSPRARDVGPHELVLRVSDGQASTTLTKTLMVRLGDATRARMAIAERSLDRLSASARVTSAAVEICVVVPPGGTEAAVMTLCDARGRTIVRREISGAGVQTVTLDRRNTAMTPGVHVLRLTQGRESLTRSIVLK